MINFLPAHKLISKIETAIAMSCCEYDEVTTFHTSDRNLDLQDKTSSVKNLAEWDCLGRTKKQKEVCNTADVIFTEFRNTVNRSWNPIYIMVWHNIQVIHIWSYQRSRWIKQWQKKMVNDEVDMDQYTTTHDPLLCGIFWKWNISKLNW